MSYPDRLRGWVWIAVLLGAVGCGEIARDYDAAPSGDPDAAPVGSDAALDIDASPPSDCGDGEVTGDEVCDVAIHACCNSSCTALAPADTICRAANGQCDPAETCTGDSPDCPGDELTPNGTSCDDCEAGADACDECRDGVCVNRCGNGELDEGEQCDDGPANSDTTPDACRTTCELPFCGDGVTDSSEKCDDGPLNSDTTPDACRTTCERPSCGDRVVDTGEECDGGFHCIADCKIATDLDVLLLLDLSGSMGSTLTTLDSQFDALSASLQSKYPGVRLGLASFVDKPIAPFGSTGDYVYATHQALTSDHSLVKTALAARALGFGSDGPEAQIESLMQGALRTGAVGWDADRWHVIVVITDAEFHKAGDFAGVPANDLDTVLDGSPPGTGEDYPSTDDVRNILIARRILPAFATSTLVPYDPLVASWGFGATSTMAAGGADVRVAIENAISALEP